MRLEKLEGRDSHVASFETESTRILRVRSCSTEANILQAIVTPRVRKLRSLRPGQRRTVRAPPLVAIARVAAAASQDGASFRHKMRPAARGRYLKSYLRQRPESCGILHMPALSGLLESDVLRSFPFGWISIAARCVPCAVLQKKKFARKIRRIARGARLIFCSFWHALNAFA